MAESYCCPCCVPRFICPSLRIQTLFPFPFSAAELTEYFSPFLPCLLFFAFAPPWLICSRNGLISSLPLFTVPHCPVSSLIHSPSALWGFSPPGWSHRGFPALHARGKCMHYHSPPFSLLPLLLQQLTCIIEAGLLQEETWSHQQLLNWLDERMNCNYLIRSTDFRRQRS